MDFNIESYKNSVTNKGPADLIVMVMFTYVGIILFTNYSKGIFQFFADIIYYTFISIVALFIAVYILSVIENTLTMIQEKFTRTQIGMAIFFIFGVSIIGTNLYIQYSPYTYEIIRIETLNRLENVYYGIHKVLPQW